MDAPAQLVADRRGGTPHPIEGVMAAWERFRQNPPAPRPAPLGQRLGPYRALVYFLLGLLALDVLVVVTRGTWRAYDPDDYLERLDGCRARPRDLVIVGGSPVSEGIDPEVLAGLNWRGRKLGDVYNLGLPGATTSEVWHAVEHGLAAPPRLLVYGITASDVNDHRLEPHGVRSLMDRGDLASWVWSRPESASWMVRHYAEERVGTAWQLFLYRNAVRLWAADRAEQVCPGAFPKAVAEARANLEYTADLRRGTGFAPQRKLRAARLDQRRAAGDLAKSFHFLDGFALGGHLRYLNRLLDWGEANGVAVVLVDMPVPAQLEEAMHPQAFAAYRAALRDVARERGVPVLWASRAATGIGDADFADLIHLNGPGTAKLSAWLRGELSRIGG